MYMWIAVTAITAVWWVLHRRRTRLHFPGPRGWPVLGIVPSWQFHLKLTEWAAKYGGCYKINLLGQEALVISDAALVHECQVTRGAEFAGRSNQFELWEASGRGADIIFTDPSKLWWRMRKLVHANFRQYDAGLERIEHVVMETVGDLVDELARLDGEQTDIKRLLYTTTINVIASLLVGWTYAAGSEFHQLFRSLESALSNLMERRLEGLLLETMPVLERFYNPLSSHRARFLEATDAAFDLVQSEAEGHDLSLMSDLLRSKDAGDLPAQNLKFLMVNVILAGTTTTTNTLHQMINIMAHHQEVQDKLHAETDRVLGERQVTLKDREQMPYHQAALYETLRFTSIVAVGVPHKALKDTQIKGQSVPAGTTLIFNHFALNHNEALFPDPYSFRPERFLDENGSLVPADHPNRRNMNAFGSGPRVCLGESLAKGRLFLVMASLLQRFRILPGDEAVSCDPRASRFKATLISRRYKVKFIERDVG